MLVFWILSLIAVISYLIVVEYLHDNLRYQLDMSTLDDADLEQKLLRACGFARRTAESVIAVKNILRIMYGDLTHATKNVIGAIVLVGLIVVPALYAWFNIAGSWDPYGNTQGLKVAVANEDAGYQSDLVPLEVNVGDSVVSALRADDEFDWVFTDEEAAVEGVRSGAYYAAIVIPESFSADMMTLFSPTCSTRASSTTPTRKKTPSHHA